MADTSSQTNTSNIVCNRCSFPCWRCTVEVATLHPSSTHQSEEVYDKTMPESSQTKSSAKRKRSSSHCDPKHPQFGGKILPEIPLIITWLRKKHINEGIPNKETGFDTNSKVLLDFTETTKVKKIIASINQIAVLALDETNLRAVLVRDLTPTDLLISKDDPDIEKVSLCLSNWEHHSIVQPKIVNGEFSFDWVLQPDLTYMSSINAFPIES